MTVTRDLMHAILSMDAYNRGYGRGVLRLSSSGQIGGATITRQSNVTTGSDEVNAGFYAIAYQWNGQTIISYRGTNFDPGETVSEFFSSPLVDDAINGWVRPGDALQDKRWFDKLYHRQIKDAVNDNIYLWQQAI
jgi:hypothetical protein